MLVRSAKAAEIGGAAIAVGSAMAPKYFGFTTDEWQVIGIMAGIAIGLLGWISGTAINWYFKRATYKLNERAVLEGLRPPQD